MYFLCLQEPCKFYTLVPLCSPVRYSSREMRNSATFIFSRWHHRANMWQWETLTAAGEIRRHPVCAEHFMADRATLILILDEEFHVSDLRAPMPVIGQPCWFQIHLNMFQMVETDDRDNEAPLIYRRPSCGSSWRKKKCFFLLFYSLPVFRYTSVIFSKQHSCFMSTTFHFAVSCFSTAAIRQPTSQNILCIFPLPSEKRLGAFQFKFLLQNWGCVSAKLCDTDQAQ